MSNSNDLKPYLHQQETINNLNREFKKGNTKQLVVLPSGSGKTHTIAFHVRDLRPGSFLYVVHRNEILYQSIKVFKETIPWLKDADIGIVNFNRKEYDKPFLFATIQTISRDKNLEYLNKNINYVVIDEFHHAAADTYQKILQYIKPKYLIGLTATPYRLDNKDIIEFVDENIAIEIDLFEAINNKKILVPLHYIGLFDNIDYTTIKHNGYKYNIGDLDRKLIIHKRDQAVLEQYNKLIRPYNKLTIGFCNSIDHVKRVTSLFIKNGIRAAGLTFKDSIEYRRQVISDFRKGYYDVIFTRDIFNEGMDFPECEAILFLRPTISKAVFFQQLGRGLRKKEGKNNVIILDFIGNYYRAFDKKEWFLGFAQKEFTGLNIKPEYIYNPSNPSTVYFDSKVISMFDIENKISKTISGIVDVPELISRLQSKLGRNYFSLTEWREHYGKTCSIEITALGGFSAFRTKYNVPNKHEVNCQVCGKLFPLNFMTQKWIACSNKCRDKIKWKQVIRPKRDKLNEKKLEQIIQCPYCNKDINKYFKDKYGNLHFTEYCSRECRGRHYYQLKERNRRYGERTGELKQHRIRSLSEIRKFKDDILLAISNYKQENNQIPPTIRQLSEMVLGNTENDNGIKQTQFYVRKMIADNEIDPQKDITYLTNKRKYIKTNSSTNLIINP